MMRKTMGKLWHIHGKTRCENSMRMDGKMCGNGKIDEQWMEMDEKLPKKIDRQILDMDEHMKRDEDLP